MLAPATVSGTRTYGDSRYSKRNTLRSVWWYHRDILFYAFEREPTLSPAGAGATSSPTRPVPLPPLDIVGVWVVSSRCQKVGINHLRCTPDFVVAAVQLHEVYQLRETSQAG